jgi:hypothetical protein
MVTQSSYFKFHNSVFVGIYKGRTNKGRSQLVREGPDEGKERLPGIGGTRNGKGKERRLFHMGCYSIGADQSQ